MARFVKPVAIAAAAGAVDGVLVVQQRSVIANPTLRSTFTSGSALLNYGEVAAGFLAGRAGHPDLEGGLLLGGLYAIGTKLGRTAAR
jgi:hypothetical protein